MSVYNQNRGGIIQIIIGTIFFLIVAQLVSLQVVSNKYKLAADNNAFLERSFTQTVASFTTEKREPS